jgi:hypothetical protein
VPVSAGSCVLSDPASSVAAGEKATVWAFNFFFYNKKMKRILYIAVKAVSKAAADEDKVCHNCCWNSFLLQAIECWSWQSAQRAKSKVQGVVGRMMLIFM